MSQSPYIVNIVELQNVVTNVQGTNTAANIQSLQTAVENLQQMVLFDTKTIAADVLSNFTASNSINVVANLNLSNAGLYSNSNVINFTTSSTAPSSETTSATFGSFSTLTFSTLIAGDLTIQPNLSTLTFSMFSTPTLTITSTGTLLYTSSPTYFSTGVDIAGFLYVSQSAYVKNLYQTSDQNLKTNLQSFSTTTTEVLRLEPKRFEWKSNGQSDLGFIAQEVQSVWPELVSRDPYGSLNLEYSKFIPLLLESIRELNARIEVLEKRVL